MSILIITNKSDITSDFIVRNLTDLGLNFYRLNTEDIGRSARINFDFYKEEFKIIDTHTSKNVNLNRVTSVYYRRPEINEQYDGLTKGELNFIRGELAYTLEGLYKILDEAFWVNKVPAIRNAENKIYQLLLAKEIGFIIPDSLVTSEPEEALNFYKKHQGQCIIKPIKSGLIEGGSEEGVIFTTQVTLDQQNASRISSCPVYLQTLIKKQADIRVTVVGDELFAAMIHSQQAEDSIIDWRKANKPLPHTVFDLPENIKQKCIALTKRLDLNYGAIDFILDISGSLIFLEINPNGQWAWIESRLHLKISDGITKLLTENLGV